MAKVKDKKENKQEVELIKMDAQGQPVGRLASEIAFYLQGKHRPDYAPNKSGNAEIELKNADKVEFSGRKWSEKVYYRHSGHLGHLKEISAQEMFDKKPEEILRLAVWGMLPKNRLRKTRIKRLKFV